MRSIALLLLLFPVTLLAQYQHCGTAELMKLSGNKNYYEQLYKIIGKTEHNKMSSTIDIPVVVHVVYNTSAENIHDSLIFQQIDILNDDFNRWNADTVNTPSAFAGVAGSMDINFCLAQQTPDAQPTNGILRVFTNTTSFASPVTYAVPDPVKHDSLGGSDAWNTNTYLNIWVCDLTGSTAYSAPPGNFMPDDEGIVCKYQHFGKTGNYPYGEGRSITHEAGHFFGLKHIWGDDGGTCTGTDWIADTPNQGNFSTNCPTFPQTDNCSTASPGIMFMNYMDYAADGCRNMFTNDQVTAMTNCITNFRSGFLTAIGCNSPTAVHESDHKPDVAVIVKRGKIEMLSTGILDGSVMIYNSMGKVVYNGTITESGKTISTQGWAVGIYVVAIQSTNNSGSTVQKVVIR